MEGAGETGEPLTFPRHTPVTQTIFKLIIDPIDGTRGLMYDKRSAWALAGLAPQRGPATGLRDIATAAMTELPTTKQWRADQLSAVRGGGPNGLTAVSVNVFTGERHPLTVRPSRATDFQHGFASFAKFFPEGKALTAQIEEAIWDRLHGRGRAAMAHVFDDQYLSTGGQIYELLMGHDRLLGDLRPLVLSSLGYKNALTCHPYDICTGLLLTEAGGVLEAPTAVRSTPRWTRRGPSPGWVTPTKPSREWRGPSCGRCANITSPPPGATEGRKMQNAKVQRIEHLTSDS